MTELLWECITSKLLITYTRYCVLRMSIEETTDIDSDSCFTSNACLSKPKNFVSNTTDCI